MTLIFVGAAKPSLTTRSAWYIGGMVASANCTSTAGPDT
jgi:hypothetical protein